MLPTSAPTSSSLPRRACAWRLLLVACAPVPGALLGSAFNIWYNLEQVRPLLTAGQLDRFFATTTIHNACVYPVAIGAWLACVGSLLSSCVGSSSAGRVAAHRARAIHLPWCFAVLCGLGWLSCIPVFGLSLAHSAEPLHPAVLVHLPISFVIGGLVSVTHGFFTVELTSHRFVFPLIFRDARPAETPGAVTLTLRRRGVLFALAAGVCPIATLLLLGWARAGFSIDGLGFELAVGGVGVVFGVVTAVLLARLVAHPIDVLRGAAGDVAAGKLDVRVDLLRADEFGPLIDEFNRMVGELKEKERLRETFGLHVGRQAAQEILVGDPTLGGTQSEVTVLFCDIRGFTTRSASAPADAVIELLNRFLCAMVDVVESRHGGMVNKFLGDGLLAVFGVGSSTQDHAVRAVAAAREMLAEAERIDAEWRSGSASGEGGLSIGVGIATGPVILGCVGSPRRMEYTVIGDTVNVASRLESLTKEVQRPVLFSRGTRDALPPEAAVECVGSHALRGRPHAVEVFTCARGS